MVETRSNVVGEIPDWNPAALINMLGKAKTVKIDKDNTTIVGGAGKKSAINERIEEIKMQIEKTTSSYDKEQLQKRLAKLGYYAGHTV